MSESEAEQKIKDALERERRLRIQFARDNAEEGNASAEEVLRRALEKERKMKEEFQQGGTSSSEGESILKKAVEKEREMRENLVEGSNLPTLDEVIDAVEKDEMVKTIREKGLLSEEAVDAIVKKTEGLTAEQALDALKKMDVGIPDDVRNTLLLQSINIQQPLYV
jgi:hypothetical protein